MRHSITDSSLGIEEIYTQSLCSRKISRYRLDQLKAISIASLVSPQHNRLIKRLLHASRRGWISVVD